MELSKLYQAFSEATSKEEKLALYEAIKAEQRRQEAHALSVIYGAAK